MLILASSSPTRANLLKKFHLDFIQKGCDFNEDKLTFKKPVEFVYRATIGKMEAFLEQNSLQYPILCADTVVTSKGKILRKAKDRADARRILELQSGNHVSIITCMFYKTPNLSMIDISTTTYKFKKFDKQDLEQYLAGNEWKGKAGACMVEGFCKPYIHDVQGYESTAMGLCVEKLIPFLDF